MSIRHLAAVDPNYESAWHLVNGNYCKEVGRGDIPKVRRVNFKLKGVVRSWKSSSLTIRLISDYFSHEPVTNNRSKVGLIVA